MPGMPSPVNAGALDPVIAWWCVPLKLLTWIWVGPLMLTVMTPTWLVVNVPTPTTLTAIPAIGNGTGAEVADRPTRT